MSLLFRVIHHCHRNIHHSREDRRLSRDILNSRDSSKIHTRCHPQVIEVSSNILHIINNSNSIHRISSVLNIPHLPISPGMEIPTIPEEDHLQIIG